jgi:peroxiredoxin
MLKVGQAAPGFELPDADMNLVSLADYRDRKNVVLYFYPKDDTPGCTAEAIEFSDMLDDFSEFDTVILGVSRDDWESHGAFRDKHGLGVALLSDTEAETCEAYGVMLDRKMEGEQVRRGLIRSTFIIDKRGVLRDALYGVNPRGHAREVLERVREL